MEKRLQSEPNAFGMKIVGFDLYWDEEFAEKYNVKRCQSAQEAMNQADVISLHVNLSDETRDLINQEKHFEDEKRRGHSKLCERRNCKDFGHAKCTEFRIDVGGYGTDVLDVEPPPG